MFQLIRDPNAIFLASIKIGMQKKCLSTIKPLHPKWVVDMFKFMTESKDLIISGFRSAHI